MPYVGWPENMDISFIFPFLFAVRNMAVCVAEGAKSVKPGSRLSPRQHGVKDSIRLHWGPFLVRQSTGHRRVLFSSSLRGAPTTAIVRLAHSCTVIICS